jgi:hypothetical protein
MDILTVLLTILIVVTIIFLVALGIMLNLVLNEVRRTMMRVNQTVDTAERRISEIVQPLQNLGNMAVVMQTGVRIFEAFVEKMQSKTSGIKLSSRSKKK